MFNPVLLAIQIIFSLFCIFGLWKFYRLWSGREKLLFLCLNNGGVLRRVEYYGFPFFMGALLSVTFLPQLSIVFPNASIIFNYCFVVLIGIGVISTIWRPNWLKPAWWQWVEKNYVEVLPLLQKKSICQSAVQNFEEWKKLLSTRDGIDLWIAELQNKNGEY